VSNPKKPTQPGTNRTGIATSPVDAKKTIEGAIEGVPDASADAQSITHLRVELSKMADPVGTMPPPASLKGVLKSTVQVLKGNHPNVFIDLLADRCAFERTGTRIYDAMLAKFDASHPHEGGPTRADLEKIRDEELAHYHLLVRALQRLGADPTAMTPLANVCGVASMGLLQVVTDPRVTFGQALHAIHIAELTDNDAWLVLTDVAARLGMDELATEFRGAMAEEEGHLARVRMWLTASIEGQAGIAPTPPRPAPGIQPGTSAT
jgi:rubrerythrin